MESITRLNSDSQKKRIKQKTDNNSYILANTYRWRHSCDPHVIIHLTITNQPWRISHEAARPTKTTEALHYEECEPHSIQQKNTSIWLHRQFKHTDSGLNQE